MRQPDAKLWISSQAALTKKLPDAVKAYIGRLGNAGLDYRAIRICRTEQQAMLADEQTDIAGNSFICNGEMEFVLARGRDHWNCDCEEYAGQVYNVNDPGRPEIPVHPNCGCEWRPVLKTDEEMLAEWEKWEGGDYYTSSPSQSPDDIPFDTKKEDDTSIKIPAIDERMNNLGVKFYDLSTVDNKTQNEIVGGLEKASKDLPALKGSINTVTVINDLDDYARVSNNRDMELSGKWYKNPEKLAASYADDVAAGFHPAGTDYRSLITHEAAHAGLLKLAEKENKSVDTVANEIINEVLQELKKDSNSIGNELSTYALREYLKGKPTDVITEGVAEKKHSVEARPMATLIYEKFKLRLGGII